MYFPASKIYQLALENALECDKQLNDVELHKSISDLLKSVVHASKQLNQTLQDSIIGESAMIANSYLRQANREFYTSSQTSGGPLPASDRLSPLQKEVCKI